MLDARSVYVRAFGTAERADREHVVLAFDRASGALRWRALLHRSLGFHFTMPALAGNTIVYQSSDDRLYALDTRTGRRLWVVTPGPTGGSPTIANGVIYLPNANGKLLALDLRSGRTLWSRQIGPKAEVVGGSVPSAAIAGGAIFAATKNGTVVALKPRPSR